MQIIHQTSQKGRQLGHSWKILGPFGGSGSAPRLRNGVTVENRLVGDGNRTGERMENFVMSSMGFDPPINPGLLVGDPWRDAPYPIPPRSLLAIWAATPSTPNNRQPQRCSFDLATPRHLRVVATSFVFVATSTRAPRFFGWLSHRHRRGRARSCRRFERRETEATAAPL